MKFKAISLIVFTFLCMLINTSCSKEESLTEEVTTLENSFFSKEDISKMKSWLAKQKVGKQQIGEFPELDFSLDSTTHTDVALIRFYHNGIMYANDDILEGTLTDHKAIENQIKEDIRIDANAKAYLLSFVQLSKEIFLKEEFLNQTEVLQKDACNCSSIYATYSQYNLQCQAYGNYWGHCDRAKEYYDLWQDCLDKNTVCPPGFTYDGANCYSAVHFPSGYQPFIYGNGFYTEQNCGISTANNCCPPGFGYDGANCHYWGLYFPSDYEPFIYGNSFYVKAKCL